MSNNMVIAWSIAASDSSAGAGIQADLAAFAHFGVHGCSIITKITAQNSNRIIDNYDLPEHVLAKQLEALKNNLPAQAIKISVLGNNKHLNRLMLFLNDYNGFTIYDPVINATCGNSLTNKHLMDEVKLQLFPKLYLITPNISEAEIITGIKINCYEDMLYSGKILLKMGIKNVLLKGGHLGGNYASDLLINNSEHFWLVNNKWQDNSNFEIHGTGCHLSSAITANLALGYTLADAVVIAKRYINLVLRNSYLPSRFSQQRYISAINYKYIADDMPQKFKDNFCLQQQQASSRFADCGELGLYPIVENSKWVDKLASYGVKTIQLRIKDKPIAVIEKEIIASIKIAKKYELKLFINDYWALAIKYQAYGVHLGQEDLLTANLNLIKANGIRLGISTHSHVELSNAIAKNPSYIALGSIFPTLSKIMPSQPQGLERIVEWQQMIKCQLVVIGGISLENIDRVISTGARNIAMISAITKAVAPKITTQLLLKKITNG